MKDNRPVTHFDKLSNDEIADLCRYYYEHNREKPPEEFIVTLARRFNRLHDEWNR